MNKFLIFIIIIIIYEITICMIRKIKRKVYYKKAVKRAKETNKKLVSQIEDMKLPDLSLFLNDKYASIQNQQFACEVCNLPFQNKRSLGAHKKIHKNSKGSDDEISTINVNTN